MNALTLSALCTAVIQSGFGNTERYYSSRRAYRVWRCSGGAGRYIRVDGGVSIFNKDIEDTLLGLLFNS